MTLAQCMAKLCCSASLGMLLLPGGCPAGSLRYLRKPWQSFVAARAWATSGHGEQRSFILLHSGRGTAESLWHLRNLRQSFVATHCASFCFQAVVLQRACATFAFCSKASLQCRLGRRGHGEPRFAEAACSERFETCSAVVQPDGLMSCLPKSGPIPRYPLWFGSLKLLAVAISRPVSMHSMQVRDRCSPCSLRSPEHV